MNRKLRLAWWTILVCVGFFTASAVTLRAQDDPAFELHDWSVWLADPTLEHANAKDHFFSAMPGVVDSTRFRPRGADANSPRPLGMMTFYGDPVEDIEIDFRVTNGRFMAHWPTASAKSDRLRWYDASLMAQPEDAAQLAFVNADNWFHLARQSEAMYLRRGARTERFIAYDVETRYTAPVKLTGGPDTYRVRNLSDAPLHDLLICLPTTAGRRIGWLDTLPAGAPTESDEASQPEEQDPASANRTTSSGYAVVVRAPGVGPVVQVAETPVQAAKEEPKPRPAATPEVESVGEEVEVVMSLPLADDDPRLLELTETALAERLKATGLNAHEVGLILDRYAEAMFASDKMVVVFRYSQAEIEKRLPLVTYPDPIRSVRVALVVVRNIDPRIVADVRDLVVQLGDEKYSRRESAQKRLAELGRLAVPALKGALGHADPEIVLRAERLLMAQNESIDTN